MLSKTPLTASYLDISGLQLRYTVIHPEKAPTIFFIHGNSGSVHTWQNQLYAEVFAGFRLIAFDLPAHGESAEVSDPEHGYSLPALGKLIRRAIQELANGHDIFLVGLSLGTNIIAEMAPFISAKGIILLSPCITGAGYPIDHILRQDIDLTGLFTDHPADHIIDSLVENCYAVRDPETSQMLVDDYKRVKAGFRTGVYQTICKGDYHDEVGNLASCLIPILIIFGNEDKLVYTTYLDGVNITLWNNNIFKIETAGHMVHIDQPQIVNELLINYIRSI